MDMSGMGGMMGMGGMDSGSVGMFQGTNMHIARVFWYIVIATVATRGLRTLIDVLHNRYARRQHKSSPQSVSNPSRPSNFIFRSYSTLITICRESTYPALAPFTGRFTRYFSIPPLGHCLLILAYWAMILIMLWSNVILSPTSSIYGYKWEIVGFRAAWVSVTQVPLIYALSCKVNIISIATGISYERLNWIHRWVSRTLFLTVIVHWAYFFREWWLANFVSYELMLMPMVKYGFGAWAVIGWTVLTGFGFFRDLCYELWLLQHLASAGTLLWLLYVHLPAYARYNIWLSIAFVAFDRIARGIWSVVRNTQLRNRASALSIFGFASEAEVLPHDYLRLTIKNVGFSWRAGQHVFVSIPSCGLFESHPFTIASDPLSQTKPQSMELLIKTHTGFTSRLHKKASSRGTASQRAFISGPWGTPPLSSIERANSLIFIASSTGASYTVPLLEHALRQAHFVQRVEFCWIVRHKEQIEWFTNRLEQCLEGFRARNLEAVTFRIFVTQSADLDLHDPHIEEVKELEGFAQSSSASSSSASQRTSSTAASSDDSIQKAPEKQILTHVQPVSSSSTSTTSTEKVVPSHIAVLKGRPVSWDSLIRPTVEAATGETIIVACGGRQMMNQIRTYTARLSDERAVHKGTGAQGIGLFTESYGW